MLYQYECLSCGKVTRGIYKENPQFGSYFFVRCSCGKKGNSGMDWDYEIAGFKRIPSASSKKDYAKCIHRDVCKIISETGSCKGANCEHFAQSRTLS